MKIFCKFPIVNTSKLIFWLVLCIPKNFIWTTLKAIFQYFDFLHPQIPDFQIVVYRPTIVKNWPLWLVLWSRVTYQFCLSQLLGYWYDWILLIWVYDKHFIIMKDAHVQYVSKSTKLFFLNSLIRVLLRKNRYVHNLTFRNKGTKAVTGAVPFQMVCFVPKV